MDGTVTMAQMSLCMKSVQSIFIFFSRFMDVNNV